MCSLGWGLQIRVFNFTFTTTTLSSPLLIMQGNNLYKKCVHSFIYNLDGQNVDKGLCFVSLPQSLKSAPRTQNKLVVATPCTGNQIQWLWELMHDKRSMRIFPLCVCCWALLLLQKLVRPPVRQRPLRTVQCPWLRMAGRKDGTTTNLGKEVQSCKGGLMHEHKLVTKGGLGQSYKPL